MGDSNLKVLLANKKDAWWECHRVYSKTSHGISLHGVPSPCFCICSVRLSMLIYLFMMALFSDFEWWRYGIAGYGSWIQFLWIWHYMFISSKLNYFYCMMLSLLLTDSIYSCISVWKANMFIGIDHIISYYISWSYFSDYKCLRVFCKWICSAISFCPFLYNIKATLLLLILGRWMGSSQVIRHLYIM